jgi:Ran GTPase-activating protein (RanGAP) involved in mRNA processing and transport
MSGGKACGKACGKQAAQYAGKQPDEGSAVTRRDTTAPENEEHASGRTHRKSMRLKEMAAAKEAGGKGGNEKGKQPAAQKKRTRTTRQATQTQPLLLAADAFVAALGAVPAEDWCRTWAAGRTIVLRRTSKRVKEVVDKMRLPAVVRLSRSFWDDARNGTEEAKLELVLRQLAAMTARCLITTLELPDCKMKGQDAERLAGVLAQCPALAHLDLSRNVGFGTAGAERLAGVLGQCRELVHLNLRCNFIRAGGAESLAGVLGQCTALTHLDFGYNLISDAGAESLAKVLSQCSALAHLNLCYNEIEAAGVESLARVLGQCAALAHLDLSANAIGEAGAQSLAGMLGQCRALAHLNLCANDIGTVGEGRLRASWRGQASGLFL